MCNWPFMAQASIIMNLKSGWLGLCVMYAFYKSDF